MPNAFREQFADLTDSRLWLDNPLAVRDARREFRRNRVFYAILTLCLSLLAAAAFGVSIYSGIIAYEKHTPDWLGGDLGTAIVILTSGIHFWWVVQAAQRRVDGMLMREAALDGMTGLLMLPVSRFSLVLMASAYPWMAAVWVAVLLLPVYVFCVGVNGITWAELFSLYVLFALAAVAMPGFRRPALSGSVAPVMLNQAIDDPNSDPGSGKSLLRKRGLKSGVSALTMIGTVPALIVMLALLSGLGQSDLHDALGAYVPDSIISLVPSCVISLPLMLARILITPFGFYQWSIIPLPLVVVLVLWRKYLNLARTSEYLSIGSYRDLASLPSYLQRRSTEQAFRFAIGLSAVGFLWPWAVRDDGLGFLAANPVTPRSGIVGLMFALAATFSTIALVRAGQLGMWTRLADASEETPRTVTWRSAARYCVGPLAAIAVFTAIVLTLGGIWPPVAAVSSCSRILAITAAGMLLNFGLRRLAGGYGLAGCIVTVAAVWGPQWCRMLSLLSPALGIIAQGPRHLFGLSYPGGPLSTTGDFSQWVFAEAIAGIILVASAQLVSQVTSRTKPVQVRTDEYPSISNAVYDPTVLGREAFTDAEQQRRESTVQSDSALSIWIVHNVERIVDNAVLTRDLRARLRNRISTTRLIYLFGAAIAMAILIACWMPSLSAPGSGIAEAIYPNLPPGSFLHTLANLQGCFYIALPIAAFLCGYGVLPRAFGADKRKNTLSFLLTTPMSAGSIACGRATALTLCCGAPVWFCGLCALVLCVPTTLLSGSLVGLGWWAFISLSAFVGFAATAMVMLALGSLFPNLTALRLNGCIRLIVLYFVYTAMSYVLVILALLAQLLHLGVPGIWVISLSVTALVALFGLLITVGAISGMRKGDIDIKLAKK